MKKSIQYTTLILIAVSMFSCNVLDITKRRYNNGFYVSKSSFKKQSNSVSAVTETISKESNEQLEIANSALLPVSLEVENTKNELSTSSPIAFASKDESKGVEEVKNAPLFKTKSSKASINRLQEKEAKILNKIAKKNTQGASDADVQLVLLVVLAILLPPIAVYLKRGIDTLFWITLLLFLLAVSSLIFFPLGGLAGLVAVVLALLAVFDMI